MPLAIEIILVLLILLAHYIYRRKQFFQLSWNLPGPTAFPIIGNAFNFFCSDDELYDKAIVQVCFKYPSPLRFWLGPKLIVVVTDVAQAEKIMSSVKFATKDAIYKFIEPIDGKGLITASGHKWKRDRRLMSPLFLKKNIMQYSPYILEHTKILIGILMEQVDEATININPYIHKCMADIVNETILGKKTKAQYNEMNQFVDVLSRLYTVVYARMVKVWLQIEWIFRMTSYWKEQEEGVALFNGFIKKVIEEAQEKHAYPGRKKSFRSILDQLLDIRVEVPHFATDEELMHHLATLYTASEDTVTSISSFTLVLLGMYPDIQNRVIEEIENIVGSRDIEENDLNRFEYLDMVLKDVLRLFPIAPFIVRECSKDFQIEQWTIPKGCSIVVSIQNIHRDPQHWAKPNEFYPDHFLPENVARRHPYAFMPFSAGPRGCIGKPYAMMAMKIIIVTILQHFRIESDEKLEDKKLRMDISIRFKDDQYPVRLKNRK